MSEELELEKVLVVRPRRKKTAGVSRAMRFDGTVKSARAVLNWSGLSRNSAYYSVAPDLTAFLVMRTPMRDVRAFPGDFVLCDEFGAVRPVSPDVFVEEFEEVPGDA